MLPRSCRTFSPSQSAGGQITEAERLEALCRSATQVRASGLSRDDAARVYADYVQFFSAFVIPGGKVLDVRCGVGWSTDLFAERGCDATGIDLNPAAARDRLRLTESCGTAIPFPSASFDATVELGSQRS